MDQVMGDLVLTALFLAVLAIVVWITRAGN
jgi:hypothetical protein